MHVLLLGHRGAVGTVISRELTAAGHHVTGASRSSGVDLRGDLSSLAALAADSDAVVNASGIERPDLAAATGATPLIEISATSAYLDALRAAAAGPVVLGAGLAPGLSTVLVAALDALPGDEVDVFVMLGSGEAHGAAAVEWTASLVGSDVYQPPEGGVVRNLMSSRRLPLAAVADGSGKARPSGERAGERAGRRFLRADFPDHVLLGDELGLTIRSYLALSSPLMTGALGAIARVPALGRLLGAAPHIGSSAWRIAAQNRRTGQIVQAAGDGQSEATGRLTALATVSAVTCALRSSATMADLVHLADARAALQLREAVEGRIPGNG